jgi:P22_AR N-terminal domain
VVQNRELFCIDTRTLGMWLITINPGKVAPELREKLVRYQVECADALEAYWSQGVAVNPRLVSEPANGLHPPYGIDDPRPPKRRHIPPGKRMRFSLSSGAPLAGASEHVLHRPARYTHG